MDSKPIVFLLLLRTEKISMVAGGEETFLFGTMANQNACNISDTKFLQLLLAEEKLLRMELERKVKGQSEEINRLSAVLQFKNNQSGVAASERPTIAFSAKLTNDIRNSALGRRVIFSTVLLNQGDAYDVRSGTFRAPVTGIYQFSMHTCTPENKVVFLFLMKEGRSVDYTYAGDSMWSCVAVSTVVNLLERENIWVEMRGDPAGMHIESENYVHFRSGFSGVYIGKS